MYWHAPYPLQRMRISSGRQAARDLLKRLPILLLSETGAPMWHLVKGKSLNTRSTLLGRERSIARSDLSLVIIRLIPYPT